MFDAITTATALVTVSASIGRPTLTLYGYTAPSALVRVVGVGVTDTTTSDSTGYFYFDGIFTPVFTYPELCIESTDTEGLISQPTCIPPLPVQPVAFSVGPVYLSPTISFSENNVLRQDFAFASGATVPESEVNIYIAKEGAPRRISLVREALAYYVPVYKTRSDASGKYEFSLPTADAGVYRIFAGSRVGENPSAKSTTLTFSVRTAPYVLWEIILEFIRKYWMYLLIPFELLTILLLASLVLRRRRSRGRHFVS